MALETLAQQMEEMKKKGLVRLASKMLGSTNENPHAPLVDIIEFIVNLKLLKILKHKE